ncbi:MAG: DNA polymerase IV [Deltaproteobacteria bacterium]|nr:DNA polymerase IV [Deltaproteobacteria bacterium]
MAKVIAHVDMDAFFAAIEQRDRPELRGKPVVVGAQPGERGVVSTCSYEARKFGVHSAMPIARAVKLCPHAVFVRPDFSRYSEASRNLRAILQDFSPLVEMSSIDEAYLDLTGTHGLFGTPTQAAKRLKAAIREALGLTASVGIGPTRLIAKIASDFRKPDGLTIVTPEQVEEFLAPLDVGKIPGIGRQTVERLAKLNIHTVRDLRKWNEVALVRRFGASMGAMLARKAAGRGSDVVGTHEERKSVSKERTFQTDIADAAELRRVLLRLSCDVARTLRREGVAGRTVHLKIRLEDFETHTVSHTTDSPVWDDQRLFHTAWDLYATSPYARRPVRLIGVGVSELGDRSGTQMSLLDAKSERRDEQIYDAVDRIRDKFGKNAIAPAEVYRSGSVGSESGKP